MAPSPELGQSKPKAPDKVDIKPNATNNEMDVQKSPNNASQQDTEVRRYDENTIPSFFFEEFFFLLRKKKSTNLGNEIANFCAMCG